MSTGASACACCTDPGMRIESAEDMDRYERDEIYRLRFGGKAELYTTPAYPDDIEGVISPSEKPYNIRNAMGPRNWKFELSDAEGKQGTIIFPLPQRLVRFEVDPRDGDAKSPGVGPKLYKEWRLTSTAELSGMVAKSSDQAQATLILHGRGIGCTSAEHFTHWTLILRGRGVRFTLLGELGSAK